jgi:hypothetical protein
MNFVHDAISSAAAGRSVIVERIVNGDGVVAEKRTDGGRESLVAHVLGFFRHGHQITHSPPRRDRTQINA